MTLKAAVHLARLALEGGRFEEAERRYATFLEEEPWFAFMGLGMAKMGLLVSGEATMSEATRCFEQARDLVDGGRRDEIERRAAQWAMRVAEELFENLSLLASRSAVVNGKASLAALAGGLAVATGTRSSSLFGSLASLSVFDRSLDAIDDSIDESQEVDRAAVRISGAIQDLCLFVRRFSPNPDQAYRPYVRAAEDLERRVNDLRVGPREEPVADNESSLFGWQAVVVLVVIGFGLTAAGAESAGGWIVGLVLLVASVKWVLSILKDF